jgi:hypothetical protein
MNCDICFEKYNANERRPITILPCTHSLCQECLCKIQKLKFPCPKCKKNITNIIDLNANSIKNDITNNIKHSILTKIKEIKDSHDQLEIVCEHKLEETLNEVNLIKNEIAKRAHKLICLIKLNCEQLLNECDQLSSEFTNKSLLTKLTSIREFKLSMNDIKKIKNDDQLNRLNNELNVFKSEIDFNLEQLKEVKFNYIFEPNLDLNYRNGLVGKLESVLPVSVIILVQI